MDDELDAIIDILNSDKNKYQGLNSSTKNSSIYSSNNQQSEILNQQLKMLAQ